MEYLTVVPVVVIGVFLFLSLWDPLQQSSVIIQGNFQVYIVLFDCLYKFGLNNGGNSGRVVASSCGGNGGRFVVPCCDGFGADGGPWVFLRIHILSLHIHWSARSGWLE